MLSDIPYFNSSLLTISPLVVPFFRRDSVSYISGYPFLSGAVVFQAKFPVAAVAEFESVLVMMGYPANCCLFGNVRNRPLGSHGSGGFARIRWRLSAGAGPRCPHIPKAARTHTFRDTIRPEIGPSRPNDVFPIVLNSEILELLA